MRRRDFIEGISSLAIASSSTANAQQSNMPLIGVISAAASAPMASLIVSFHKGLKETGYTEGQNIGVEYRWAEGHYDRLSGMAADLVRRPVAVIAALNPPAAQAAKTATTTIPIVFTVGSDPVTTGLVASFNRPGGNATGVYVLSTSLEAKRLQILKEVMPNATVIGVLVNPKFSFVEAQLKEVHDAARTLGVKPIILNASTVSEIDSAFETLVGQRISSVLVASDPLFVSQRDHLVALVNRHSIAGIFPFPEFAKAGGLMSYGTNLADSYRQVGIYVGRILKGEKPADLPVHQSVKVQLVINLKTAKTLGLTVPATLLGRADEVIE